MVAAQVLPLDHPIMQFTADEWRQMAARKSLKSFTTRMFPGYTVSPHILELVEALEWAVSTPGARLIVDMPPRHSKSLHVSENLPAWYLGRFPDNRVIAASHTAALAYTFSRRVRNKIASDRYPFPGIKVAGDKSAVQAWDIQDHAGGYVSVGVGGSPVGQGADLIIVDDPIKSAADADSEVVRASIKEWYQGTLRTRLEPGGSIIITATRWHDDDLTGWLLAEQAKGGEQWRHIHMPAIDDAGNALWPGRWPVEALEKIRSAVGSRVWQAQYQGDPQPSSGGMFKRAWWGRWQVLPPIVRAELYLDSAFKEGVANDYSALSLWGADGLGSAYLVRAWRDRVDYPGLMRLAHDAYQWSRGALPSIGIPFVIEDKASGQSAIQSLSRPYYTADGVLPALPVVPYAVSGTQSKLARAEGVTGLVEGTRALIPEHADQWDLEAWIAEHERFPQGTHDDWVDTTGMALSRLLLVGETEVDIY